MPNPKNNIKNLDSVIKDSLKETIDTAKTNIPLEFYNRIVKKGCIDEQALNKLTPEQQNLLANIVAKDRILKVQRDPAFFLFNYVLTLDSHDAAHPIKRFPYKPYLHYIVKIWEREPLIVIPKSRQMMLTWIMVALHYWLAAFHVGKTVFIQSKKEDDADTLLERGAFIHEQLPAWLKPQGVKTYCYFEFEALHSVIQAVSQSSNALRQHTATAILSDEVAFQPYASESFASAKPTVINGGKWTGLSTANGREFFYRLVDDIE